MNKLSSSLILLMLFCSISIHAQAFKTVGYFPTYRFPLLDEMEFERLTHLNIAFANPDAQGRLTTEGKDIRPVVQKGQAAGLEVYIALAGGAASLSTWAPWIKPENRSSFISGIMDYVLQYNLQGVDVDLEWGAVNEDYSGFVLELKDSLDQYQLGMTAALPAIYRYPEISDAALAAFDWVNIMAYDLRGPWAPNDAGPHSPYSFAEDALDYWTRNGLVKERMTLGVPFYAYDFTDRNNVRAYTYAHMINLNPANAQVDQVGQVYYNGLPTIERKTLLALERTSGIMIWEIGQDNLGEFSLLERIDETITGALTTSIDPIIANLELLVFPNPVVDVLQLQWPQNQELEVSLFSASAQVLQTLQLQGQTAYTLSMRAYSAGIYFLMVKGNQGVHTTKIVKQ